MEQDSKGNEGGMHLEVELERQQEIEEEEEEVEKQYTQLIPCAEAAWDWKHAIGDFYTACTSLKGTAGEFKLLGGSYSPFAKQYGIQSFCTPNYKKVFLRKIDDTSCRRRSAFLWYPRSHEFVLLTHYECSNLLPLMLKLDTTITPQKVKVHLCFLGADATRPHWEAVPPIPEDAPNNDAFKHVLVSLLLEDGRTMFTGALSRHVLKEAVSIACGIDGGADLTDFAKKLVGDRGRLTHWDGSELEDALV